MYVALGFPKQEHLIASLRDEFPQTWFLGVGFSFSFVAGETRRAPPWVSRLGLEWMHRLAQDPRRLAGRYLLHGLPFAARLFAAAIASRLFRRERYVARQDYFGTGTGGSRVVFGSGALERTRAKSLEELGGPE